MTLLLQLRRPSGCDLSLGNKLSLYSTWFYTHIKILWDSVNYKIHKPV